MFAAFFLVIDVVSGYVPKLFLINADLTDKLIVSLSSM